ncbi:ChaB family protein [Thermosynechococcaceae cyanobacterium Okahandja]
MPQDKAAIYQTRLQAGEFLLVVEVPAEKTGEIFLLLQAAGGEEVAITDMQIPRQPEGELTSKEQISPEMRASLSDEAQSTFVEAYNQTLSKSNDKTNALLNAWKRIKSLFDRDETGTYSNRKDNITSRMIRLSVFSSVFMKKLLDNPSSKFYSWLNRTVVV